MVSKTMKIDGAGKVSITNYGNAANAHSNPYGNLSDVYFHTDLDYLQLKQTIGPVDVTLPAVARSYYTWSDGKGGICFITTACVDVMGLEDDCYELRTLRRFRDKYMFSNVESCKKVATYYLHAPKIVERLNELPNKREFYEDIYQRFILKSIELIERDDFAGAELVYEQGVKHCADAAGVDIGVS